MYLSFHLLLTRYQVVDVIYSALLITLSIWSINIYLKNIKRKCVCEFMNLYRENCCIFNKICTIMDEKQTNENKTNENKSGKRWMCCRKKEKKRLWIEQKLDCVFGFCFSLLFFFYFYVHASFRMTWTSLVAALLVCVVITFIISSVQFVAE